MSAEHRSWTDFKFLAPTFYYYPRFDGDVEDARVSLGIGTYVLKQTKMKKIGLGGGGCPKFYNVDPPLPVEMLEQPSVLMSRLHL